MKKDMLVIGKGIKLSTGHSTDDKVNNDFNDGILVLNKSFD